MVYHTTGEVIPMDYFVRFAVPFAAVLFVLLTFLSAVFVWWLRKQVVYRYSLTGTLKRAGFATCHPYKKILALLRFITLLLLALLCGKPQLIDPHSKVDVEGIDIMLVLDVSGSMQSDDFEGKTRIEVAKEEALRFIAKRDNDPIGMVIFGKHAVSRCPLTLDKAMLKSIIENIELGIIDADGTALSRAVVTAVNRLKNSDATSKIMILLTDGEPSVGDLSPDVALEAAKRYGIKIYTIGIGSEKPLYYMHQLYGLAAIPGVNKELLDKFALETGGRSFLAKDPHDMRAIYDTIDKLEKTTRETDIYSTHYDIFIPFVIVLCCLVMLELFLATFVWFGL